MAQIHQYGPGYVQKTPPKEWATVGVDSTINDSVLESGLNTNIFTFVGSAAEYLKKWRDDFGVFNGVPYRITYVSENDGSTNVVFDGMIDLSNADFNSQLNPIMITAPIIPIDDNKSVIEKMFVTTQGLLVSKGFLTASDYIDLPVIRESKKNVAERALILANFSTQVVTSLLQLVNNLLSSLSDILGLSVVVGVVELLITIVNAITVINNLIDQGTKIRDLFFPLVNYYKVASIKTIIKRGFELEGYTVDFGIIDELLASTFIMASQNEFDGYPFQGFPATGELKPQDFGYTIGEMIDGVNKMCNIRADVRDNVVHLKNIHDPFWATGVLYSPEKVLIKSVSQYQNGIFKDDTERVKGTFILNYVYDTSDTHTLTDTDDDAVEIHRDLINELNPKMNLLKGIDEIQIPWAMCVRKKPFDNLWDLFTGISDTFDLYLQQFKDKITEYQSALTGGGVSSTSIDAILAFTGFGAFLQNREGCLKIDDNSFAIPKIVYLKQTTITGIGTTYRIPENFKDYIGAPALYRDWYFPDSPAIQNDFKGQYRLIKSLNLPWSSERYNKAKINPYFFIDGKFSKFTFINWIEAEHKATTDIEFREPFDKNITENEI